MQSRAAGVRLLGHGAPSTSTSPRFGHHLQRLSRFAPPPRRANLGVAARKSAGRLRSRYPTRFRLLVVSQDDAEGSSMKGGESTLVVRDVVLVGGGHSHVYVLKNFGMKPMPGVRLTMVARDVLTPYSGMLPGHVAGHYTKEECHVDLRPLAAFAKARLIHASATGLDLDNKLVHIEGRPPIRYDVLSVDIGITPAAGGAAGADSHATPVKPINGFSARWERLIDRVTATATPTKVVVVGGGAGGVELALAMQFRLRNELAACGKSPDLVHFTLVTRSKLLPSHNEGVGARFREVLAAEGMALVEGRAVEAVKAGTVVLADGASLPADECVWCTDAGAQGWLRDAGLATDDRGFMKVEPTLESMSHAGVFGCGDIANVVKHPRPKAGVFAVRQGPPLAANIRRALLRQPLEEFVPQTDFMGLISTGDKYAVLSRGSWALGGQNTLGSWLWAWKNSIDLKWMYGYSAEGLPQMSEDEAAPPPVAAAAGPAALDALKHLPMRCGGCGAKVGATVLSRVMKRLDPPTRPEVLVGLESPDDAAVVELPPGYVGVHTVDYFRSFVSDPFLFGQIAAVHALGDCWGMGAEPVSALAIAQIPFGLEEMVEEDFFQIMSGAVAALREANCALVGGHTCEGTELALGFAINGMVKKEEVKRKGGMTPGQALILTKPVGTGVLFAADMRGQAKGDWISAALDSMRQSSAKAADVLKDHGATAATDVTGFGLLGHLVEMAKASKVEVAVDIDAVPKLPGAVDLVRKGIFSSLQPANMRLVRAVANHATASAHEQYPLLFDPQTAGGILASVPCSQSAKCVEALKAAGYAHTAVIGEVLDTQADPDNPAIVSVR